jgi:DNA primase
MIDEIKNKIDIVDFISQYIPLKGAGNYYKGLCPFHSEKSPSFYVSPEKRIFKCFGCNEWGSVIDFLIKMENVDFKEAVRTLAEKAGIEQKEFSSAVNREKNIILEINRVAVRFFSNQLKQNKDGLDYLFQRGLSQDTIDYFELGYAPFQNELRDYLFGLGYSLRDIQSAGLLTQSKTDRFQQRIIFPFVDEKGKVIGFTGRIFPEKSDTAKYLNTSETQLFKKSEFLYGLYYAVPYIKEEKCALVVEGQMDFLAAWQSGLKNVVAISGTAFTEAQLKILKRYGKKIVFALDEDEAGLEATLKSAPLAVNLGFSIEKLVFAQGKDLAESLGSFNTAENKEKSKIVSLADYLFDYGLRNFDLKSAEGKKKFLGLFLPQLIFLDLVEKSNWVLKLAQVINIDEKLIYQELEAMRPLTSAGDVFQSQVFRQNFKIVSTPDDRYSHLLERLLALVLALERMDLINDLTEYLEFRKDLVEKIKKGIDDEEREIIELRALYEKEKNQNLNEELNFLVKAVKKEYIQRKIQELKQQFNIQGGGENDKILTLVKNYTAQLREL